MAAAKIVGASALFLSILLTLFFPVATASNSNYSLVVAQITSLSLTPSLLVEKSPAFKPGTKIVCERVDITGLSRLKNIRKFPHSVKVNVSYVLPSRHPPIVHICFHRNATLGVGMCPQGPWGKISKDSWARIMSPFDHKLLDICISGSSSVALKVSIDEDFSYSRIIFLIFGSALMTIAWALSKSLFFYYGSAMTVGVLLVILMILFQGMKLLPTGRKNSLAMFIYASTLGFGAVIFRDVPRLLLHSLFGETGIGEEYNPLIIFILLFLLLVGAWLGIWAVRKLILADDGSIDEGVANFVAWSIWIIGAVMIMQVYFSCQFPSLKFLEFCGSFIVSREFSFWNIGFHRTEEYQPKYVTAPLVRVCSRSTAPLVRFCFRSTVSLVRVCSRITAPLLPVCSGYTYPLQKLFQKRREQTQKILQSYRGTINFRF